MEIRIARTAADREKEKAPQLAPRGFVKLAMYTG